MGLSTKKPLWRSLNVSLSNLETKTVDLTPYSEADGFKYVIKIKGNNLIKLLEILVSKFSGDITDTVYSRLGDFINVDLNILLIGSDVVLQAVNGESFPVEISVKKLIV